MRKLIIAVASVMALAVAALPSIASADVPRCQDTVTTPTVTTAVSKTATFNATQPSGAGGNWVHHYSVTVKDDGTFTGTNVITGQDYNGSATVNETVSGSFSKTTAGVDIVTFNAERPSGLYTFKWGVTNAPMDGVADSMNDGTVTYATAENWTGGPLPITFTAPDFKVETVTTGGDTTTTTYKNHGDYVSIQGGGKAAAQACVGMPIVSKQGKS
jgi:hypothetical protein